MDAAPVEALKLRRPQMKIKTRQTLALLAD